MRGLEILLTFIVIAGALGWGSWRVFLFKRAKTLYFSGGSMDGKTIKLVNPPRIVSRDDEIYQRQDDGIYMYKGDVDDKTLLSYKVV